MAPWMSRWWPMLVKCAERGGHTAAEIIVEVLKGHAIGWPVDGGYLVLCRTEDDAILIWLGVGTGVRKWCGDAEREIGEFAHAVGCNKLRITGRRGWQRVLPDWSLVGEDLEKVL